MINPISESDRIQTLLHRYGLHPKKGLSQNFLQDDSILETIVQAASIKLTDTVLEIGPGLGSLTQHIARAAHAVIAVELDESLVKVLAKILSGHKNVRVIHGDILKLNLNQIVGHPYLVIANIPYNITSTLIRHFLESDNKPERIVLTIQKEVAERICARPGDLSLLALSVQVYGQPILVRQIPADAFFPVPKVDSAVIRIDLFAQPAVPAELLGWFFQLAKAGFSQKRKTLRNSLAATLGKEKAPAILQKAGIDAMRRAETLTIDEWIRVCIASQS